MQSIINEVAAEMGPKGTFLPFKNPSTKREVKNGVSKSFDSFFAGRGKRNADDVFVALRG